MMWLNQDVNTVNTNCSVGINANDDGGNGDGAVFVFHTKGCGKRERMEIYRIKGSFSLPRGRKALTGKK